MTGVWSIVVAGGSGQRFGRPKQFRSSAAARCSEWAVDACRPVSSGVVLVVPADGPSTPPEVHGADVVVTGGPTRAESVRRGLAAVPDGRNGRPRARRGATARLARRVFEAVVDAVTRRWRRRGRAGPARWRTPSRRSPRSTGSATSKRPSTGARSSSCRRRRLSEPTSFVERMARERRADRGDRRPDAGRGHRRSGPGGPGRPRQFQDHDPGGLRAAEQRLTAAEGP